MNGQRAIDLGLLIVFLAGGMGVLSAVIVLAGASPAGVASALWQGALGTPYNRAETLIQTVPLLLTGLGVALAFQARLFNIGAEGQFLAGAVAATWVGTMPILAPLHLPFVLVAGAIGGALWAMVPALLKLWRSVQEVLSTLLLNFVAVYFVTAMVMVGGPLNELAQRFPQSEKIKIPARLALLGTGTRLHSGVILALLLAAVIFVFVRFTAAGFSLRVVGAGEKAAEAAGIRVPRTVFTTFLLSGALSGVAGAVQISGVTYFLADRYSPGYGYTAIAVALLADLSPLWLIPSALFFGAVTAGGAAVQQAGISSVVIQVLQSVVLLTLLGWGWARRLVGHLVVGRSASG